MRNTILSRLGFIMVVIGGLLALFQSQTTVFGGIAESAVIGLGGGLLMVAGIVVVSVVTLKQRVSSD